MRRPLTVNSPTPYVGTQNWVYTQNTATTVISNFLSGSEGQTLEVELDADTYILNGGNIRTKDSLAVTGSAERMIGFRRTIVNGIYHWSETWRNFP